jgi:hypothetical protein
MEVHVFAATRILVVLGVGLMATEALEAQKHDKNVITLEEIERAQPSVRTAYEAVQMLRPRWLQRRELSRIPQRSSDISSHSSQVHVYLNDHDQGDVEYLRSIPAERVLELRWLGANEAGSRFGPTAGPVIVVTLQR